MKAVIMAGGSGVRLRPFTYSIPKPLLTAGGITSIENSIKILSKYKINEIFILTHYKSKMFSKTKAYEKKYSVKIKIVNEKAKLGTVGGLYLLKKFLKKEKFILLNGDIFFSFDIRKFINFHTKKNSFFTIGLYKFNYQLPYALVNSDKLKKVNSIKEKPKVEFNINSGIYIIDNKIFKYLNALKSMDMPDLIKKVSHSKENVFSFDIGNKWIDLGRIEDYKKVSKYISKW